MNNWFKLLKYTVFVVNFFVTIAGLTLIVLATICLIIFNKGMLDQEEQGDVNIIYWAAVAMIALGVVMTVIGFLGSCGALKENQCLLATYSAVMLIGIGLAVGGTVMLNRERDSIAVKVRTGVERLFRNVSINVKAAITLQKTLVCCGGNGYGDWNKTDLVDQFPASCCSKRESKSCPNPFKTTDLHPTNQTTILSLDTKNLYHEGCINVIQNRFQSLVSHSPVILGIVILIQAVAFVVSLILCCSIKKQHGYDYHLEDELQLQPYP